MKAWLLMWVGIVDQWVDRHPGAALVILFLALTLLPGCTRTVYVDKIIEVPVEVFLPCKVKVPEPLLYPLDALPKGQPAGTIIFAFDKEVSEREEMEERLRYLLRTCTAIEVASGR